jgi:hypothetical protein
MAATNKGERLRVIEDVAPLTMVIGFFPALISAGFSSPGSAWRPIPRTPFSLWRIISCSAGT